MAGMLSACVFATFLVLAVTDGAETHTPTHHHEPTRIPTHVPPHATRTPTPIPIKPVDVTLLFYNLVYKIDVLKDTTKPTLTIEIPKTGKNEDLKTDLEYQSSNTLEPEAVNLKEGNTLGSVTVSVFHDKTDIGSFKVTIPEEFESDEASLTVVLFASIEGPDKALTFATTTYVTPNYKTDKSKNGAQVTLGNLIPDIPLVTWTMTPETTTNEASPTVVVATGKVETPNDPNNGVLLSKGKYKVAATYVDNDQKTQPIYDTTLDLDENEEYEFLAFGNLAAKVLSGAYVKAYPLPEPEPTKTEEPKKDDNKKSFWKKPGPYIIIAIVVVLLAVAAVFFIKRRREAAEERQPILA